MKILSKLCGIFAVTLTACATTSLPPVNTVATVDLPRFMGDWYVIAHIPTSIEKEAYNGIENYKLNADETIATTFTFNKGALNGEAKKYEPKGFVVPNTGNALWGMQFIWPIKAEYKIAYLDPNYQTTVIARTARDYVWIMARKPHITATEYKHLTDYVAGLGYDMTKLRVVPQN